MQKVPFVALWICCVFVLAAAFYMRCQSPIYRRTKTGIPLQGEREVARQTEETSVFSATAEQVKDFFTTNEQESFLTTSLKTLDNSSSLPVQVHKLAAKAEAETKTGKSRETAKPVSLEVLLGKDKGPFLSLAHYEVEREWETTMQNNVLSRQGGMTREVSEKIAEYRQRKAHPEKESIRPFECFSRPFSAMNPRDDWCVPGGRISSASMVVVRNVCVGPRDDIHFLSNATESVAHSRRFPSQISINIGTRIHFAQMEYQPDKAKISKYKKKKPKDEEEDAVEVSEQPREGEQKAKWKNLEGTSTLGEYSDMIEAVEPDATVVFISHHQLNHITHFMEPLGVLDVGINGMMKSDCAADDLTCFSFPKILVSLTQSIRAGSWQDHVLHMVLKDPDRKVDVKKGPRCFGKAVFPGTFYGIWPPNEDTDPFRDSTLKYITKLGGPPASAAPTNVVVVEGQRRRRVLISVRTTKRRIVDLPNFIEIVESAAHFIDPEIEVSTIQYGKVSFLEQASRSREADVLLSLHGADLTNMIFQRKGSAVVELNPLFFFENRFYEMAEAMGLHYFAWSCTGGTCAFGGSQSDFDGFVNRIGLPYSKETRRFREGLRWPYKGYPGQACPKCSHMACCGALQGSFFGTLRENNVASARHRFEIMSVLFEAFAKVKWITLERAMQIIDMFPRDSSTSS